jgi:hypothetical protein
MDLIIAIRAKLLKIVNRTECKSMRVSRIVAVPVVGGTLLMMHLFVEEALKLIGSSAIGTIHS